MKRIIQLLLVLVLLIPTHAIASAQALEDIPLEELILPGNNPHSPSLIPISAYLIPSIGLVELCANPYDGSALVLIENVSTGAYSMDEVYIGAIPTILPLLGSGYYTITITLSSGHIYFGSFSYNNT